MFEQGAREFLGRLFMSGKATLTGTYFGVVS